MVNYQLKALAYHLQLREIKKLFFSTTSFRDCCLLKSLFWAGLRREEATRLDVRDINFDRKRIKIRGKGNKARTVPILDDELFNKLKSLLTGRTAGLIFVKSDDKPLTVRMINHITTQAGEKAGIKNPNPKLKHINPHIFRHSIVKYLKNKGLSAEWIQNFLGHTSYKTTMDMYGTLSIDEMQQEVERKLKE
ncbi:MAG: tyrosine-type recombinase/integrase [Candidatus Hodarchaeota archaeon]